MLVAAVVEFTTDCLGSVRKSDGPDQLLKTPRGKVMFLPKWWRSTFDFAANAVSCNQKIVKNIQPDVEADGDVTVVKRFYGEGGDQFTEHEAFAAGSRATFRFMVPHSLNLEQFERLLTTIGAYRGISPYGWRDGYGRFTVVEVTNGASSSSKEVGKPR